MAIMGVAKQLLSVDLHHFGFWEQEKETIELLHNSTPKQVTLTFDFVSTKGNGALQSVIDHLVGNKSVTRLVLVDTSPSTCSIACSNRDIFFNFLAEELHLFHFRELELKGGPDLQLSQATTGLPKFIALHTTLMALSIETPCSFCTASIICESVSKSKLQSLHLSLVHRQRLTRNCILSRYVAKCVGLRRLVLKYNGDIDERDFKTLTVHAIPELVNLRALEIDFGDSNEGRRNNLESLREALLLPSSKVESLKVITSAPISTLDPVLKNFKVFHYRQLDKAMASRDQNYLLKALQDCVLLEEVGLHIPRRRVARQGLIDLCAVLSRLPKLKRVNCLFGIYKWDDTRIRNAILNMVKSSSSIVQLPPRHHFQYLICKEFFDQICYFCECNGVQAQMNKILRNDTPIGLWPHILEKLTTRARVLHSVVCEKHDVLVKTNLHSQQEDIDMDIDSISL